MPYHVTCLAYLKTVNTRGSRSAEYQDKSQTSATKQDKRQDESEMTISIPMKNEREQFKKNKRTRGLQC